jgi:hypothetical protein
MYARGCILAPDNGCYGRCILHYDSPEKDVALFKQRLEEKDPNVERIGLSWVVFHTDADFSGRVFKKDIYFRFTKFYMRANFNHTESRAEVSFRGAGG